MIGQNNLVIHDWSKINLVTHDWVIVTEKCPMNGPRQSHRTNERSQDYFISCCPKKKIVTQDFCYNLISGLYIYIYIYTLPRRGQLHHKFGGAALVAIATKAGRSRWPW